MGQVLRPPPTDFTGLQSKRKTDIELLTITQDGVKGTAMGPWKRTLSEQDIHNVLAYIRKLSS